MSNGFAAIPVGGRSNAEAVRVPKTAELVDEMREMMEPPAARMVADRNSEKAVPFLRHHIETEMSLVKDRAAAAVAIAEFHRLMLELSGNQTMIMISQALAGLVEEHLKLAQRRETETDLELLEKRTRFGLRSHTKLVDLIETKDGHMAEVHWRKHMIAAGKHWLQQVGPNSVVDLLGRASPATSRLPRSC